MACCHKSLETISIEKFNKCKYKYNYKKLKFAIMSFIKITIFEHGYCEDHGWSGPYAGMPSSSLENGDGISISSQWPVHCHMALNVVNAKLSLIAHE